MTAAGLVERLDALYEKATPGEWHARGSVVYFADNAGGFSLTHCPQPEANPALIAALHNGYPALRAALSPFAPQDVEALCKRAEMFSSGGITNVDSLLRDLVKALRAVAAENADWKNDDIGYAGDVKRQAARVAELEAALAQLRSTAGA